MKFLRTALADGPTRISQLQIDAAVLGLSKITVRRAAAELHITSKFSGLWNAWFWSLPGDKRRILTPIEHLDHITKSEHLSTLSISLAQTKTPPEECTYEQVTENPQ
jgi:hypothetical protein